MGYYRKGRGETIAKLDVVQTNLLNMANLRARCKYLIIYRLFLKWFNILCCYIKGVVRNRQNQINHVQRIGQGTFVSENDKRGWNLPCFAKYIDVTFSSLLYIL